MEFLLRVVLQTGHGSPSAPG